MRLLIAPLHYVANPNDGSEYTRAYNSLVALSKYDDLNGDVLVGHMNETQLGNFTIHSYFKNKPEYISNLDRIKFIFWVYLNGRKLLRHHHYDVLWHNGPFAIGETFNLLLMQNKNKIQSIVGPIFSPHTYMGSDEARSMGNKNAKYNLYFLLLKNIDHATYFISKLFKRFSHQTLSSSNYILTIDTSVKQILQNLGHKNIYNFMLGNDMTPFLYLRNPHRSSKIHLLSVSYLVERKRTTDLIKGIKILVEEHKFTDFIMEIVGDGPQLQSLKKLAISLRLTKYIRFMGFVPNKDLPKYYRMADIFISASISESMPAMYLEAMASSLPLIIARNNCTPDLQRVKFGGLVINQKSPKELAMSIYKLVTNPSLVTKYGQKNYAISISKYSHAKQISKLVRLMRQITGA